MKIYEKEGKSTSKIINDFIKEHNVSLNDFKFEVVEKGSSGFFYLFGAKPTRIKFMLPDMGETLKNYTEGLLNKIGIVCKEIEISNKDKELHVSLKGVNDPGFLIGKDARLLNSVQHIVNQMINKQEKKQHYVKLDVDGYRERKKDALLQKVKSIANKVKSRGKSITIEPLHAANRRIVHKYIETQTQLKTMTIGEGEYKKVVILPADQARPKNALSRHKSRNKSTS